jgi:hypothetical protein
MLMSRSIIRSRATALYVVFWFPSVIACGIALQTLVGSFGR